MTETGTSVTRAAGGAVLEHARQLAARGYTHAQIERRLYPEVERDLVAQVIARLRFDAQQRAARRGGVTS